MIYGTLTKSDVFPKDEFNGLLPPKGQPENTISSSRIDNKSVLYLLTGAVLFLLLTRGK